MAMNQIMVRGRLGRDPEKKTTQGGQTLAVMNIAVDGRGKNAKTMWYRVSVWGKQGDTCVQYLTKGSEVIVVGEPQLNEFTDKNGTQRQAIEINAREVDFLSKANSDNSSDQSEPAPAVSDDFQPVGAAVNDFPF